MKRIERESGARATVDVSSATTLSRAEGVAQGVLIGGIKEGDSKPKSADGHARRMLSTEPTRESISPLKVRASGIGGGTDRQGKSTLKVQKPALEPERESVSPRKAGASSTAVSKTPKKAYDNAMDAFAAMFGGPGAHTESEDLTKKVVCKFVSP